MEEVHLSWWAFIAWTLIPAVAISLVLTSYYRSLIQDVRYEKHIDLEALKKQHHIDLEILRDRLSEENKAHLRTIQLLTRSRDQEQSPRPFVLEEMLRLKEGEEQPSKPQ